MEQGGSARETAQVPLRAKGSSFFVIRKITFALFLKASIFSAKLDRLPLMAWRIIGEHFVFVQ
jgi:hypothetical protein